MLKQLLKLDIHKTNVSVKKNVPCLKMSNDLNLLQSWRVIGAKLHFPIRYAQEQLYFHV